MRCRSRWPEAATALCLAVAGPGSGAQDVSGEGRLLFTQVAVPACALCHTLKQAGATGEVGPSLDELRPDAARVEKAIRNGIGQMPANKTLSEAQIKLLARYVAASAGN